MRHAMRFSLSRSWLPGIFALSMTVGAGCHGTVGSVTGGGASTGTPGSAGATGASSGMAGTTGSTGSGGTTQACATGTPTDPGLVVAPQRLVRLTFMELGNSLLSLFGATAGGAINAMFPTVITSGVDINTAFPPLDGNREGTVFTAAMWTSADQVAQAAGAYVFANFAAVTACTSATDACAQAWLNALAQKAYRRPLTPAEMTRFTALYTSFKGLGSGVQEATQYTVYAILSAPQFLYRSELGDSTNATAQGVPLTPYELATEVSFFLTESPPDATLLSAAADGSLTSASTLSANVTRLLGTQAAQDNLTNIMFVYYNMNLLDGAQVDTTNAKYAVYTTGIENAMYTEAQMFLKQVLWNGQLTDLLTTKTTFVNTDLANLIYKIPVPSGATQSNFVQATLGPTRAGLVTNSAFITQHARAASPNSLVPHGIKIKRSMLCLQTPPRPAALAAQIATAASMLPNQTAVQQVQYRASQTNCAPCHTHFDQYGLLLEGFDMIGRDQTVDNLGQPVVTATALPSELGGVMVQNAVDFANVLAGSPYFVNCMTESVMQYAMVDVNQNPVQLTGCPVQTVAAQFNAATNKTFTELVREVATATPMLMRVATN